MINIIKDFISLFYPEVCTLCGEGLNRSECYVCMSCIFKLPKTNYHLTEENELYKELYNRIGQKAAAAWCFYAKGNNVQQLVHELKYERKWELGVNFGKWYGAELKHSPAFASAQIIVPVPIHPNKLKRRGYNQAAVFAEGISKSLNIPVETKAIVKVKETETQTHKRKYERWENVQDIFRVTKPQLLENTHVLLVDDVITTGATIEACTQALLSVPVASVCIAAIGYTKKV